MDGGRGINFLANYLSNWEIFGDLIAAVARIIHIYHNDGMRFHLGEIDVISFQYSGYEQVTVRTSSGVSDSAVASSG